MGDPAGVGPEIILKAWAARADDALAPFVVYGDPTMLRERARLIGSDVKVAEVAAANDAKQAFRDALPVIAVPLAAHCEAGKPDVKNAAATIASIERAVSDTANGMIRAVVTAPISKGVLYQAGFDHPGHTEFLGALADRHWPGRQHLPVMMLASDLLRVVPLTIHVALENVPGLITRQRIFETVHVTHEALRRDFGIAAPRIAVCGLNPHAGEGGTIGREDATIIAPAIRELRAEGISVTGPHSADTLFHAEARKTYDAAIAMYHDQALIPIKTLSFDDGVNVTLGLPFVRTSPDHGTAFDIASQGRARATSLIAALKMADAMSARRMAVRA